MMVELGPGTIGIGTNNIGTNVACLGLFPVFNHVTSVAANDNDVYLYYNTFLSYLPSRSAPQLHPCISLSLSLL